MNNIPDDPRGAESSALNPPTVGPPSTALAAEVIEPGFGDSLAVSAQGGSFLGPTPSLSMFAQAKWWIVAIFLLIASTAVPAIWLLQTPVFAASGVIRVAPVVSRIVFSTEENGMIPLYSSYLNTQVSIIRSPSVLERVLDRADVRKTGWYNEEPSLWFGPPLSALERLQEALNVRPRPRTELINVRVTARRSADVKILADAVVDEYERYSDQMFREQDNKRSETLRNEKTALHNQILSLVDTKLRIAAQLGTTSATDFQSQLRRDLSALEMKHAEAQRELEMVEWDLDQFPSEAREKTQTDDQQLADSDQDAIRAPDATAEDDSQTASETKKEQAVRYARDHEWRQRSLTLEGARHQLSVSRQKYGEAHPLIAQRVADVEYAERLLGTRESQLDDSPIQVPVFIAAGINSGLVVGPAVVDRATVTLQRDRLAREVELLSDEIKKQRLKLSEVGDVAREIANYDEEIAQKSDLRNRLRNRLTALDLESRAPARISIASHAIRPSRPVKDRRVVLTVFAIIAALGIGLGGAYLRLVLDTRICEAKSVQQTMHVPFLGQLPPLSKPNDLRGECGNVVMMERIRMVRTSLLERLRTEQSHVVLITSSSSQTGKTTFSFLLGRSLALLGKRTLLVEADLRKPSLFKQLRLGSNVGLKSLLSGASDDRAAIVSAGVANLDLITAGEQDGSFDPELLANGVFDACLKRWRKSYDFIILDSPPVLPVADARILSRHADGTIMVLRSAHCRRSEVAQAYADLNSAGANVLGTVLMGAQGQSRTSEYYGYETYFENQKVLDSTAVSGIEDQTHRS